MILGFALAGMMRGCPRLELSAEGIALTNCWSGTRRMAWRDLERVEIRRNARADWENVALIPARGPTMLVGQAIAPANELRAAIEEVAARMKATARKPDARPRRQFLGRAAVRFSQPVIRAAHNLNR